MFFCETPLGPFRALYDFGDQEINMSVAPPPALAAQAGKPPIAESIQQKRLYHFKPVVTKSLDPQLADRDFLKNYRQRHLGLFPRRGGQGQRLAFGQCVGGSR